MEKILISTLLIFSLSLFVLSLYLHIQLKKKIKRLMTKKPNTRQRKAQLRWNQTQKMLKKHLAKRLVFVICFGLVSLMVGLTLPFYSENRFKASSENTFKTEVNADQNHLILDTPEQSIEKDEVPEKTGTQENPQPFSQPVRVAANFLDLNTMTFFPAELEVTVLNSIRGEEAWRLLVGENQFNPMAPAGKEYILNRLKCKIVAPENPTAIAKFSEFDFNYYSKEGNPYERVTVIAPDRLGSELEVNVEKEGYLYALIDSGDVPVINYQNNLFLATE